MSRYTQHRPPCFITARFPSTCPETGTQISKGDSVAYYPATRKAYHDSSAAADHVRGLQFAQAFNMADANW
jgi:hypothetical protein